MYFNCFSQYHITELITGNILLNTTPSKATGDSEYFKKYS